MQWIYLLKNEMGFDFPGDFPLDPNVISIVKNNGSGTGVRVDVNYLRGIHGDPSMAINTIPPDDAHKSFFEKIPEKEILKTVRKYMKEKGF